MQLAQADVDAVISASKAVSDGARLAWRKRNEYMRVARVPVELRAIEVGEVLATVNVAHARWWSFKFTLRGVEVRRWDFLPHPPCRHSNPPGRPAGWPGKVRALEHEHVWFQGLGTDCARPLDGTQQLDHHEAYARFCHEIHIDPRKSYEPPPALGQQLKLT